MSQPPNPPDETDRDPEDDPTTSAADRARALLLPVSSPTPPPPSTEDVVPPVLPGRPEPPRPNAQAQRSDDEQGVTCWNCGFGNRTDRVFCRNCGVELARVPQAAPPPRPKRSRKGLFIALGALAAVILLVLIAIPLVGLVRDQLAQSDRATPAAAQASVADPGHPAQAAFDDNDKTWYGTGQGGDSRGQTLTAQFGQPVDFTGLRIVPGATSKDEQARPHQIEVVFTDAQGGRFREVVTLDDYEASFLRVRVDRLVRLDLTLASAYGAGAGKQVAIREVALFGKPSGR
ncbi:NADase-type glycan-binding domain-containing protein [Cryptosporangium japonicum]|uniref:F5/8 type C domain-containing protein n=1 Tax=Cryptosporangium japonicum TaxID=80872 RepID=A0ABN0TRH8_9ACTN